jgi:hypothetical protein
MKRGVLINLLIFSILLFLAVLPVLIMFVTGQTATILDCGPMDASATPEGFCGTLYIILFLGGILSLIIVPIMSGLLLLYLLGALIFFAASWVNARTNGEAVSPMVKGMGVSSLALILLVGCIAGGLAATFGYYFWY